MAVTTSEEPKPEEERKPDPSLQNMSTRDRLLKFMAEGPYFTHEEGEEIRKMLREARWENFEEKKPLLPLTGRPGSRERMLAAMAKITPISQETADMINNAVMEARERSIDENLTPSEKQETLSRRERVLALVLSSEKKKPNSSKVG